ncbi:MAG: dipeptide/oligopeptide/nickel ABC transporter ATP-binding protein [Pseudomonadota bacterium]
MGWFIAGVMLSLQGIYKHYTALGGQTVVADGLDLQLAEGKVSGLIGPSGSGKSTLGRLILGLEAPDRGKVLFDGVDISTLTRRQWSIFRKNVQMVPQHPDSAFNPRRTLGSSLLEVFRFHEVCKKDQEKEYMAATLDHVRIHPQLLGRYPSQLSGGELQRLAIARAILTKPRFLVLDEVTSMLDVSVQAAIIRTLEALKNHHKIGYLIITHHVGLARIFCDSIACLEEGKLYPLADAI